MRLFIAINVTEEFRYALEEAQDALYAAGMKDKYTEAENLHLTLAFIGEYPDPEDVMEALKDVDFSAFTIRLSGFGNFGDLWWAGIQESKELKDLVRKVRHALAQAQIPYDRKKFSPHFTLVRRARMKGLPGILLPDVSMEVDKISLMRSDRGKYGMIYTEVGELRSIFSA